MSRKKSGCASFWMCNTGVVKVDALCTTRGFTMRYYMAKDVAREWHCSTRLIYRLIAEKRLDAVRLGERRWLITDVALDRFLTGRDDTPDGSQ